MVQTADVKQREQLTQWITMLLSKDPSQRPVMASVKEFLDCLVRDMEAIDKGLATLGQDGDVSPPPIMFPWAIEGRAAGAID